MTNEEKRPCPFCGASQFQYGKYADLSKPAGRQEWYQVECLTCGASGPKSYEFQDGAIKIWNVRQNEIDTAAIINAYQSSAAFVIGSALVRAAALRAAPAERGEG